MHSSEKPILVNARPDALPIDSRHTAVIVVDMQNDFGSEGGMFALNGLDLSGIKAVVPTVANVLAAARRAGILVIYLKMAFRADLSDAGPPASANFQRHTRWGVGKPSKAPDGTPSRVLIRDTWNTDIVKELKPETGDITVYKHRYSGFFETELDTILKSHGITSLIFTGCTTSVCVESTLRDAMFRDYTCLVLEDCTNEVIGNDLARTNHDASLLVMQLTFGWVAQSADFISAVDTERATRAA
jgi:ureidoacrylate peracid hydrolase